ncbi:MAG: MFS transporter [Bryobacteraceae bacterium]|jgi:MFS family permease
MRSNDTVSLVSPARAWTIASLLFVAGFINYLDRAIVSIALPVIAVDLHLGPTAKGVLLSAFFWSYALMQLPVGWAVDRYNLRWLYAASFALWSLACGFTGLAASLGALLFMRAILGIGESIYLPGGMKIVSVLFGAKDRGLASGLMNCGTRAGLALGAPLIAFLVHSYGWHASFSILGFGSVFWLIPWLAVFPSNVRFERTAPAPSVRRTLATLDRNLLGMCLGHFGYGYYWYLLVTWLPDYLVESRHMTPLVRAGGYTMIPFLVFAASEPLGGWIADRLVALGCNERRSRKAVVTAAFLTSAMLLVAGRTAGDAAAVLMIGAASLVGLSTGNLYVLTANSAPESEVGVWMGVLNFAGNISGVVAPIVTGVLIARTGSYYPGFVVAVVTLLFGLPAYWFLVGEKKQHAAEVSADA